MNNIMAFAGAIANNVVVDTINQGGINWDPAMNNFHFAVPGPVHFHPQSTVGIKFEKIGELIQYLTDAPNLTGGAVLPGAPALGVPADAKAGFAQQIGWSGQADQIPFKTSWAKGLTDAQQDLAGRSNEAIGFAAMLYGLANYTNSKSLPQKGDYMKYYMPFMPRQGLSHIYNNLVRTGNVGDLDSISQDIRGVNFIPDEMTELQTYDPTPTIDQLLNVFGRGGDVGDLVPGDPQSYGDVQNLVGVVGQNDIGPSATEATHLRQGTILELRKLGNDVTPLQLGPFALAVFDLVEAINRPPAAPAGPAPPAVGGGGAAAGGGGNNGCCGGGCFLTTACCEFMGLPDDCEELTTLRWFRDNYLIKKTNGKELIALYYKVAPVIVAKIDKHPFKNKILKSLYTIIKKCVDDIKAGNLEEAQLCYATVTMLLSKRFYEEY